MARATQKQLEYAEQIARSLNIKVPEQKNFDSINQFIAENRKDFYAVRNQEVRDNICASISILSIAQELGFTATKVGHYYSLKEHDSVRIDTQKNCFWQNSQGDSGHGKGGSVIDFMKTFSGRSMADIMIDFTNRVKGNDYELNPSIRPNKTIKQDKGQSVPRKLKLPEMAPNMRCVYAYLTKSRYINSEIVQDFVDRKMLYQDNNRNCVFVARDEKNEPVFACKRGTNTFKRFVGDVANCNYEKGFYINNNANKLIVTESVIDAMSVMQIIDAKGQDYHDYNYLPLAGATKFECLINQLKEHPVTDLYLGLDNDKAGLNNIEVAKGLIKEELPDSNMSIYDCVPNYTKDWNEEIKYAFDHQVNESVLDFFNEGSQGDKKLRMAQQQLENVKDDTISTSHNQRPKEELELE